MSRRFAPMVLVASLTLAIGTQLSVESTVGQEKTSTKPTPAKVTKKPSGRLPAQYGKLGLSTEQRTKIYEIQADYKKQIGDLQKQIDALKGKQTSDIQAILTPDQKKKLDELLAAAKKATEARRKKPTKK